MDVPDVRKIRDLDAQAAQQIAVTSLAALGTRSAGAAMSLMACGYVFESFAHSRSLVECVLRGRQITDDSSGSAARAQLHGRPQASLKKLANRYGDQREIEFLDRFAHPDIETLRLFAISSTEGEGDVGEQEIDVRPSHNPWVAGWALYTVAYETVGLSVLLAQVFEDGLELRGFLDSEMKRLKGTDWAAYVERGLGARRPS